MKSIKGIIRFIIASAMLATLTACMGPPPVPPLVVVKPNETAFVIPLEGDTKAQQKFESVEFLNAHKVQSKRIEIPIRERSTGRLWNDYEWIPTVRVVTVDRSLITREWKQTDRPTFDANGKPVPSGKKLTAENSAIAVQSKEAINFHIGINITALVEENDASTYLYWHNVKTLTEVIDTNVKGFIQGVLSREFGKRSLEDGKKAKNEIFVVVDTETKEHFKKYGITILNIGNAGGLEFDDLQIQAMINQTQTSEMSVQVAMKNKLAQDEVNKQVVATAIANRAAAEEFAKAKEAQMAKLELDIKMVNAQATLEAAKKWNGAVPSQILPQGSNFLFGLDQTRPPMQVK